jgi:hypothetical protein
MTRRKKEENVRKQNYLNRRRTCSNENTGYALGKELGGPCN